MAILLLNSKRMAAVLIELWERCTGVDKWPDIQATITDKSWRTIYSRSGIARRYLASVKVQYQSEGGVPHWKWISFWGKDPGLDVGDWFYIRCCPENPLKVYVRETAQQKFMAVGVLGIFVSLGWLRHRYRA
jgi:hypothetical protein